MALLYAKLRSVTNRRNAPTDPPYVHFNMLNQRWCSGPNQRALQRRSHVSLGSKSLHIKDPLCTRSMPLNPTALMCYIVAPFSTSIPTLSPSPMEVIKRALFTLDHRASRRWALQLPCLIRNSLCGSLEMT